MALDSVTATDVMDDVVTPTIENNEIELFIMVSILTLKNKKEKMWQR